MNNKPVAVSGRRAAAALGDATPRAARPVGAAPVDTGGGADVAVMIIDAAGGLDPGQTGAAGHRPGDPAKPRSTAWADLVQVSRHSPAPVTVTGGPTSPFLAASGPDADGLARATDAGWFRLPRAGTYALVRLNEGLATDAVAVQDIAHNIVRALRADRARRGISRTRRTQAPVAPADRQPATAGNAAQAELQAMRRRMAVQQVHVPAGADLAQWSESARHRWLEDGLLVSSPELARAWHRSRQALDQARARGELFAMGLKGRLWYPQAFTRMSADEVYRLCRALGDADPAAKLLFLHQPQPADGGRTVLALLSQAPQRAWQLVADFVRRTARAGAETAVAAGDDTARVRRRDASAQA